MRTIIRIEELRSTGDDRPPVRCSSAHNFQNTLISDRGPEQILLRLAQISGIENRMHSILSGKLSEPVFTEYQKYMSSMFKVVDGDKFQFFGL